MLRRKKNNSQFKEALKPLVPSIWRFAFSLSGSPDTADDLTQSTCVRALEKQHQFKSGTNLQAWCFTICRSIWLNELRSSTLRKTGTMDAVSEDVLVDLTQNTETNIFARQVFTKVMELPEAIRNTVVLVYVEGYAYREAAEILDVPIGTVMSRLAAARKKLNSLDAQGVEKMSKGKTK